VSPHPQRRWLLFTAGALAAGAGGGWSWWRNHAAAEARAEAAEVADFWSQRFPKPEGGELVMAEQRGRALVLNFWATWCAPCIKELPELARFHRDQAGKVQVIGLAVDRLEPVQAFLKGSPLGFPVGLAGMAGTDVARQLGNQAGVLPFTVVFDARGQVVRRKLGETTYAELEAWTKGL
jgi:thiol-disulfide isomerase/thioredoxin